MDAKRSLYWTGYYFLYALVPTVLGLGLVGLGLGLGALDGWAAYSAGDLSGPAVAREYAGSLGAIVAGLLVLWLGKTWALYRTLTAAVRQELEETYDTERVKSEILSVLDDRLSDMQSDLGAIQRQVERLDRQEPGEATATDAGEDAGDVGFEFN